MCKESFASLLTATSTSGLRGTWRDEGCQVILRSRSGRTSLEESQNKRNEEEKTLQRNTLVLEGVEWEFS